MRLRQLTDPREDNCIDITNANACNDASADEHVGILAGCLEGSPKYPKPCTYKGAHFATKLVASPTLRRGSSAISFVVLVLML